MYADTFHKDFREAMEESGRRRAEPGSAAYLTRVERSPYGGYRVRSIPADLFVDQLIDGVPFTSSMHRRIPA